MSLVSCHTWNFTHSAAFKKSSSFFCGRSDCDVNFYLFEIAPAISSSPMARLIRDEIDAMTKHWLSANDDCISCLKNIIADLTAFKIPEDEDGDGKMHSMSHDFTVSYWKSNYYVFSLSTFRFHRNPFVIISMDEENKGQQKRSPHPNWDRWKKLSIQSPCADTIEFDDSLARHKNHHLNYWCHLTMALNYLFLCMSF
jgi:hypothetical protein